MKCPQNVPLLHIWGCTCKKSSLMIFLHMPNCWFAIHMAYLWNQQLDMWKNRTMWTFLARDPHMPNWSISFAHLHNWYVTWMNPFKGILVAHPHNQCLNLWLVWDNHFSMSNIVISMKDAHIKGCLGINYHSYKTMRFSIWLKKYKLI